MDSDVGVYLGDDPESTGKVVGKVEQERVSPKGPLNDGVPVHVRISK